MRGLVVMLHFTSWLGLIALVLDVALSRRRVDKDGGPWL